MKRLILLVVIVCVEMWLPHGAFAQTSKTAPDASRLTQEGFSMCAEQCAALEKQLESTPNDVETRTKLLGYYFFRAARDPSAQKSKVRHILWMIQNSPQAEVFGHPEGRLLCDDRERDAYEEGKRLWLEQVRAHSGDVRLLGNAASYFQLYDGTLSGELLKSARKIEPANPKWPEQLGALYLLEAKASEEHTDIPKAKAALACFQQAFDVSDSAGKYCLRYHLADAAIKAGETSVAKKWAEELVKSSQEDVGYADDIHHGHIILGQVALKEGNLDLAKKELVQAGDTPGSPVLSSFGPNMELARELLVKGEKATVLVYLESCRKFWSRHSETLNEWSKAIKSGEIPDFGGNLLY